MIPRATPLLLALSACTARPAPPLPSPAPPPAPNASTSVDRLPPPPPPAAVDPEADAMLDEGNRLSHPKSLYFSQEQRPPRGFRPLTPRAARRFPEVPFAEVRGFAYRFADSRLALCDPERACPDEPVMPDGTLSPEVVHPGVRLSEDQVRRLLALVERPDEKMRGLTLRCGFDPHHAFVFYDARGAPIAEIMVCFSCGEWMAMPAPATMTRVMGDHYAALQALCQELQLGGCWVGRHDVGDRLRAAVERRRAQNGGSAGDRLASGLGPDQRLDALSVAERRRLCVASAQAMLTEGEAFQGHPGAGYECRDGRTLHYLHVAECVARGPRCGVSVGAVEACMRRLPGDVCEEQEATRAACDPVRSCLPAVRFGGAQKR